MRQRLTERPDLYGLARFYRAALGAVRQMPVKENSPAVEGMAIDPIPAESP